MCWQADVAIVRHNEPSHQAAAPTARRDSPEHPSTGPAQRVALLARQQGDDKADDDGTDEEHLEDDPPVREPKEAYPRLESQPAPRARTQRVCAAEMCDAGAERARLRLTYFEYIGDCAALRLLNWLFSLPPCIMLNVETCR